MITSNDIVLEQIPGYLVHARKVLCDVEAIYQDDSLSIDAKKSKIALCVNE
jgi:hypothetical protein